MSDQTDLQDAAPNLRDELIANGAHANQPDMKAIIQQLQQRIQALETERGVPSDPVEGAKANLLAHIKARIAQHPTLNVAEMLKAVEELPEKITKDHTDYLKTLYDEAVQNHTQIAHDLSYWPELITTLAKAAGKALTTVL